MQTLKLSFSLPDDGHPDMEVRLHSHDPDCSVVIALPTCSPAAATVGADTPPSAEDEYVLGGYAGI